MKILNIEKSKIAENKTDLTLLIKSEIFTVSINNEKLINNPNYVIEYMEKMRFFKSITKKDRIDILRNIQHNPCFGIVVYNEKTKKEYRIK